MSRRPLNLVPENIYVLARVWSGQTGGDYAFKFYPDPHRLLYDRELQIVTDVNMVGANGA